MILADKIIYLRKKCGWSQEELADLSQQLVLVFVFYRRLYLFL